MKKHIMYEESSGNVFADLGVSEPKEALIKADLAIRISQLVEERGLTQKEAAALFGVAQPNVSKVMRGNLSGFSIERLIRFLGVLDQNVDVVVTPQRAASSPGASSVCGDSRAWELSRPVKHGPYVVRCTCQTSRRRRLLFGSFASPPRRQSG